MKPSDIKVGGVYSASVDGKVDDYKVLTIDSEGYGVRNMRTKKVAFFKSAKSFKAKSPSGYGGKTKKDVIAVLQNLANNVEKESDQRPMEGEKSPLPIANTATAQKGSGHTPPTDAPGVVGKRTMGSNATSAEGENRADPTLSTDVYTAATKSNTTDTVFTGLAGMLGDSFLGVGVCREKTPSLPAASVSTTGTEPGISVSGAAPTTGRVTLQSLLEKTAIPQKLETGAESMLPNVEQLRRGQGRSEESTRNAQGVSHVEVPALAGTGKTTTVVQGLIALKGGTPSVTPSDQQREVWRQLSLGRSDSVRVSAFNTSITNEMKHRVDGAGLNKKGVECKGVHGLGFGAVIKAFGPLEPNGDANQEHICKLMGKEPRDVRSDPKQKLILSATDDLVSLCKQTLTDADDVEALDELVSRFDIDTGEQRSTIYDLVPQVMERCLHPQRMLHWDDMVWLPVVLNLPVWKVDVQIIDEAQDLNRMQQELVYRGGRRVIYVGDRNQAIYGFAGADSRSMGRMADTLNPVKCPLTVTRRCGKAIVQEARKYVPEFEAHESNPEGTVGYLPWTFKESWVQNEDDDGMHKEREAVEWEKTYAPHVKEGAMVLCRANAPLVGECFRFIQRGVKASIMGKKIGKTLIKFIEKAKQETVEKLLGWLDDWYAQESAKELALRFPSENKLQALADKFQCVRAFCKDRVYVRDVVSRIHSTFADKLCPKCGKGFDPEVKVCDVARCDGTKLVLPKGVKFCSIHKSKGLEADQVFFLQPPGSGPRLDKMQSWELEQERNLSYVAITRAIRELYYVR